MQRGIPYTMLQRTKALTGPSGRIEPKGTDMSTQTLNAPLTDGRTGPSNVLQNVRTFFQAVADSLSAAHEYKRLTANGMQPADAARRVFETNLSGR
jgi:hypothetical protein